MTLARLHITVPGPPASPSRFVSCIDEMCCDSVGIDVPESRLVSTKGEPTAQNSTRIAVEIAKAVFEIAISDRPGHVARSARLRRDQFLEALAKQLPAVVALRRRPFT